MTRLETIEIKRAALRIEAAELVEQKEMFFGDVDIESPMSQEEKNLTREIASVYSELNSLVQMVRKIKKENKLK
jgi:hypothetical protein